MPGSTGSHVLSPFDACRKAEMPLLTWANDRRRDLIAAMLADLAALSEDEVSTKRSLMRDLVRSVEKYGVPVPARLVRLNSM